MQTCVCVFELYFFSGYGGIACAVRVAVRRASDRMWLSKETLAIDLAEVSFVADSDKDFGTWVNRSLLGFLYCYRRIED